MSNDGSAIYVLLSIMMTLSFIALVLFGIVRVLRSQEANGHAEPPAPRPVAPKPAPKPAKPPGKPKPAPRSEQPAPKPKPEPEPVAVGPSSSARSTPLKFSIADKPNLALHDFHGDATTQHEFAAMLTAVRLAADGWYILPSTVRGGRGIDVLGVREVKGGGGFEAIVCACAISDADYEPASMSDEAVMGALDELYAGGALDEAICKEMMRGLEQGGFMRKELWRHTLSTGVTTIFLLDRSGKKVGRPLARSAARLMRALFDKLNLIDHAGEYVGEPAVEIDEGEKPSKPAPPHSPPKKESEEIAIFGTQRPGHYDPWRNYGRVLAFRSAKRM